MPPVFQPSSMDAYKALYMLALLVAQSMILLRLPKKPWFALRFSFSVLLCFLAVFLYPSHGSDALASSLMFMLFYLLTLLLSKWSYDISWNSCFFCTIAGYSIQHMASIVYNLLYTLNSYLASLAETDQFTSVYGSAPARFDVTMVAVFLETYPLIYFILYIAFVRRIRKNERVSITSPFLFGMVVLMMLVEIVLNAYVVYHPTASFDVSYFVCASLTNFLCTLCVLMILFGQLLRKNLENELEIVRQLRRQEKQQYDFSKETIDMINIKCHDMKHQIHRLRHSGTLSNEALKEVEKSIEIYDSIVKTGCDALDVILAEKSLFCQRNGISIDCIADGEKLAFISETDIYSLFGNLLDNAIRSVMSLEPAQRTIALSVKARGALLSVSSHNRYDGDVRIEGGLPQTTQADHSQHGFGTKSMSMIVEKYGGTISFLADQGTFTVSILFPLVGQNSSADI